MLVILVILSILSGLLLVCGAAWLLLSGGGKETREGDEVGREIVGELMVEEDQEPLLQKTAFKGRARQMEVGVSYSFAEVKEEVRAGRWNTAAPLLMAIGGLLGLIVFGALALLVALDDKLVGAIIVGVVFVTVIRIVLALVRA